VLVVAMAVLGLVVGSFLNVVIYRVPRRESLLRPGSRCPSCGTPIKPSHNIPVVSWVVLRGRCFVCGRPIAVWYPLVELATSLLFVAVTLRLSNLDLLSALPAYLYFAAIGVALTVIDLQVRRLPNAIVLPSYPVVAVLLVVSAAVDGDWWAFVRALLGGAVLFAFFFALGYFYPAGMGFGDVKLAAMMGAFLGLSAVLVAVFLGVVAGGVTAIVLLLSGLRRLGEYLPFGTFLALGGVLAALWGRPLLAWYLG